MRKIHSIFLLLAFSFASCNLVTSQNVNSFIKKEVKTGATSFNYYCSDLKSKTAVLLFHDWFGISGLSYELGDWLNKEGYDVILMDLYKGKSAKTNNEAAALMNSIDQTNVWNYIDKVIVEASIKHENVILWGFSLGTMPASNAAIKNNTLIDGLILFYGNVTQDKEQLEKITFPTLMVMGAQDNPNGAINYFNGVNESTETASLFIYPKAKHAFAQKLFNNGANYNEPAKEASLKVAFEFLNQLK